MVDCWHPRECALLINILGAKCPRCYVLDPVVKAHIELALAKAQGRRMRKTPRRNLQARGLRDAERARTNPRGTSSKPLA